MLLDNGFTNDRRVLREANTLTEAGYQVNLLCMQTPGLPREEEINGFKVLRILPENVKDPKAIGINQKLAKIIATRFDFDVLHCHDQFMLNLGVKLKKLLGDKPVLVYDSHELFHAWPLNVDSKGLIVWLKSFLVRKYLIWRERKNAKHIDYLITVNTSLADDLETYFKLGKTPIVLRNIPELPSTFKRNYILRDIFKIPKEGKLLVFIGGNIYPKTLNLEQVIEEFANKPNTHLVFISSDRPGKRAIESWVKARGYQNIYFHGLIKPEEIPAYLSSADAGLVPTWNKNDLSYWYALDNKLFEYMMSEIPVLATNQPEYKRTIDEFNFGVCVNPDVGGAYWTGFQEILERKEELKAHARKAKKVLNWDIEKEELMGLYNRIKISKA